MQFIVMVTVIGVLAAVAKIVVLLRLGVLRKLMGFHFALDLAAGALFAWLFFGTLTGMVIAAIAGLVFSLFITVYRRVAGYERLTLRGWRDVRPHA
jgi:hypothetical protein